MARGSIGHVLLVIIVVLLQQQTGIRAAEPSKLRLSEIDATIGATRVALQAALKRMGSGLQAVSVASPRRLADPLPPIPGRKLNPKLDELDIPENCPERCNGRGKCLMDRSELMVSGRVRSYVFRCKCDKGYAGEACQSRTDQYLNWFLSKGATPFPKCCNVCKREWRNPSEYDRLPVYLNPFSVSNCNPELSMDSRPEFGSQRKWAQQILNYEKPDNQLEPEDHASLPMKAAANALRIQLGLPPCWRPLHAMKPNNWTAGDVGDVTEPMKGKTPKRLWGGSPIGAGPTGETPGFPKFPSFRQMLFSDDDDDDGGGDDSKQKETATAAQQPEHDEDDSHRGRNMQQLLEKMRAEHAAEAQGGGDEAGQPPTFLAENASTRRNGLDLDASRNRKGPFGWWQIPPETANNGVAMDFVDRATISNTDDEMCCVYCDFDFWAESNAHVPFRRYPVENYYTQALERQRTRERIGVGAMLRDLHRRQLWKAIEDKTRGQRQNDAYMYGLKAEDIAAAREVKVFTELESSVRASTVKPRTRVAVTPASSPAEAEATPEVSSTTPVDHEKTLLFSSLLQEVLQTFRKDGVRIWPGEEHLLVKPGHKEEKQALEDFKAMHTGKPPSAQFVQDQALFEWEAFMSRGAKRRQRSPAQDTSPRQEVTGRSIYASMYASMLEQKARVKKAAADSGEQDDPGVWNGLTGKRVRVRMPNTAAGPCCLVCPVPAWAPYEMELNQERNRDIVDQPTPKEVEYKYGRYIRRGKKREIKPCCNQCPSQFWIRTISQDEDPFWGKQTFDPEQQLVYGVKKPLVHLWYNPYSKKFVENYARDPPTNGAAGPFQNVDRNAGTTEPNKAGFLEEMEYFTRLLQTR